MTQVPQVQTYRWETEPPGVHRQPGEMSCDRGVFSSRLRVVLAAVTLPFAPALRLCGRTQQVAAELPALIAGLRASLVPRRRRRQIQKRRRFIRPAGSDAARRRSVMAELSKEIGAQRRRGPLVGAGGAPRLVDWRRATVAHWVDQGGLGVCRRDGDDSEEDVVVTPVYFGKRKKSQIMAGNYILI